MDLEEEGGGGGEGDYKITKYVSRTPGKVKTPSDLRAYDYPPYNFIVGQLHANGLGDNHSFHYKFIRRRDTHS